MACAICETRKPRRFCPGVRGDICSVCCGTEREVSVDCPLDCEYLLEARKHEKLPDYDPHTVPNHDIRITEKFVQEHDELMIFLGGALYHTALEAGAVDFDVREALESLIRTYRTLQSGVYYESLPQNPYAANVHRAMQVAVAARRRRELEQGLFRTRDADVLGGLVFFQRIEYDRSNGRRRGRAFLDVMREYYGGEEAGAPARSSSLILP